MAPSITTLKDVALAAGVAVSTASRALAGNPVVAKSTRDRVLYYATEMNYRPNAQARALRNSKSHIIGVIIPSLVNPYFAAMADAIQHQASIAGYSTIISSTSEDPDQFIDSLHVLADQRVDGILVVPYSGTEESLATIADAGTPVVLVDRELPGTQHVSVASDPHEGIAAAVAHLVEQGHRQIGYLSGPMSTSTGQSRYDEFLRACAHHGLENQPIYHGGYDRINGVEGTTELLEQGVSAIIAGDTMMSIGALEACHSTAIKIGEDLALIGFDDQPVLRLQANPISVIDQQVGTMGRTALELLLELMAGKDPPPSILIPTHFIVRSSSNFTPRMITKKEVSS